MVHLEQWYAQSHPDEDFAETFAVWLAPDSNWRERYAGWPALRKLEYVDALMPEIAGQRPAVVSRRARRPLSRLRKTLRQHYAEKRRHYGLDADVSTTATCGGSSRDARSTGTARPAARFLGRIRREVRRRVAQGTGEYQYTIDQVLEDMIDRCRELGLRLAVPGGAGEARLHRSRSPSRP